MRTRPFKGNLMVVKLLDTSPWIKRLTKVIFALLRVLDKASRGHQHILESPFGRHELTNKLLWERTCLLLWPFKKDFGLHISMVLWLNVFMGYTACVLLQQYACIFDHMAAGYFYHTLLQPNHIHVWNHLNLKKPHFLLEHIHSLPVFTV